MDLSAARDSQRWVVRRPMTRLKGALLVSVLAAVLIVPPLGQRILAPSDEVRFVLYAREVLRQRVAFDIRIREKLFREKPPLCAWTIAVVSLPGGRVTEATAQLPVVASAIVAVVFTFLLGERLFSREVGMLGALGLVVTYGFFAHSQVLLPDMLVVAFTCAAMYAFALTHVVADCHHRTQAFFYMASAGAVYAKGPVGLLPFLIGIAWLWCEHGPRALRRLWGPLGVSLFVLITLTWIWPFLALGGATFVMALHERAGTRNSQNDVADEPWWDRTT